MSAETILAKLGITREQVNRAARRYGKFTEESRHEDKGKFEEGDDLVEAINDNRPGYLSDKAAGIDAAYHGSLMDD